MASSGWHTGQNPQIKKSSQGSLEHAAVSIAYIHRQQRHKSSTAPNNVIQHYELFEHTETVVKKKSINDVIQHMI